jgi:type IV fimbrial biogenesis protein FimT
VEYQKTKVQSGFSLVELMIALAIMAILLKMASPSYGAWISNQEIRAGAESIINAVNLAKLEAMKRNGRVMFELRDSANNTSSWRICPVLQGTIVCDPAQPTIQERDAGDDSPRAKVGVSTASAMIAPSAIATPLAVGGLPAGIIFDGLGRPSTIGGFQNIARVDVRNTNMTTTDERRLVIAITGGGSARACDPQVLAPNARAC